ncbi:TIGR03936 family radical SAM-associated protein [Roseiconus lacunae]|uniref:TIGR03936 family radical SAM-associated protein n=1 Tax=Roseiconus lacunae TaxID=2605694 RepID=A0ABT7PHG3_9BACT|nr:TIGR03936 family radical SAM-associated protein [Roseiconus lacunae]MCD0461912.1 TIGR03936 family radical SAM-associated protein [Roseiconus lacunae]MDM4015631.1 TIGR03936 family radical SAM-associated protein [Roseiconus lacunae]WRQ52680.1 TIGR03936 family radical SAM-associated protein [Stieleria sp. HD01]
MSSSESNSQDQTSPAESPQPPAPLRLRYRIRFAKTGLLRWTSHRDLARLWERLLRRAQLQLSMTEGFHPKPRISFPSALALGISGKDEVVELDLAEHLEAGDLLARLRSDHQPGLEIKSVQFMPAGSGKAKLKRTDYVISRPDPDLGDIDVDEAAIEARIDAFLKQESVTVTRKKKPLTVQVSEQVLSLTFGENLELSLAASDAATLKPTDVLDLIGLSDWIAAGSQIIRTEVVLASEVTPTDPNTFASAHNTPQAGDHTEEVLQ